MAVVELFTFKATRGKLQWYADRDLEALVLDATPIDTEDPSIDDVNDFDSGEISGGTYARAAVSGVSWDTTGEIPALKADDLLFEGLDLTEPAVAGQVVIIDTGTGEPVAGIRFPPVSVVGSLPIHWNAGTVATLGSGPDLPDATSADAGMYLLVDGEGKYSLGPAPTVAGVAAADGDYSAEAIAAALAEFLDGGGGGGDTAVHVFAFVDPSMDLAVGDFDDIVMLGGGSIPRTAIVSATVAAPSGDSLGVWIVTESGGCTPGDDLAIADQVLGIIDGRQGLAITNNGTSVTSISVAYDAGLVAAAVGPVADDVDELTGRVGTVEGQTASLDGRVDTLDATTGSLTGDVDGLTGTIAHIQTAALAARVQAFLSVDTPPAPAAWAKCGDFTGFWACPTNIPSPTSTMRIRSLARFVLGKAVSVFAELYSQSLDGDGADDRFEMAIWQHETAKPVLFGFFEWTETGAEREQWLEAQGEDPQFDPALAPAAAGIPPVVWVELETILDLAAGTATMRARLGSAFDYTDADDDTTWLTLFTYEVGAATSLIASAGEDQWIGRGGGRFDVARVRRWDDGVLVMDFDPSTADDADTAVADSVLEVSAGVPAVWTATGTAAVEAA